MNPKTKNLLIRTASGAVFATLVVGSFFVPRIFQYFLFLFFAIVGTWEYATIVQDHGINVQKFNSILATICVVTAGQFNALCGVALPLIGFFAGILILLIIPIIELFRKNEQAFSVIAHTYLPVIWVGVPFALASILLNNEVVLSLFLLIWASDSFAYLGGSMCGKHKLFERISPKKTWEGSIIGCVLTCGLAAGLSFIPYFSENIFFGENAEHWKIMICLIGIALIAVVIGTLGDLIESMFKRSYGIKDSGKIMPGHGGILDRFDSFFMAMPFTLLFLLLISNLL